jgi:hypothetical protein
MFVFYFNVGSSFRENNFDCVIFSQYVMIVMQKGDVKDVVLWLSRVLKEVILCGHVIALVPVGIPSSKNGESGLNI